MPRIGTARTGTARLGTARITTLASASLAPDATGIALGRAHGRRRPAPPTPPCGVCASLEVETDEVFDRGLWVLSECGRCGHRWTAGPFDGPTPAPARVRPVPPPSQDAVA
jgi:hypothetical protein